MAPTQARTRSLWRLLCSQPIQMVSLSEAVGARSCWTCSVEGAMHRVRQADTHRPQSMQGSQSLARLGRLKISSP